MSNADGNLLDGVPGAVTAAAAVLAVVYGVLVFPGSVLGGLWIVAVGLSLAAAVLVGSTWGRQRLGLSPAGGRSAALAFVALAILLAVGFVPLSVASFSDVESTSSASSLVAR
jgi:hypothetical protein